MCCCWQDEEAEAASLEEVIAIQVRRELLERWYKEPFFDKIIGCVVRCGVPGQTSADGGKKYRVYQVTGMKQKPRMYAFGPPGQPGPSKTNLFLVGRYGSSSADISMDMVSNHSITEEELDRWDRTCSDHKAEGITRRMVSRGVEALKAAHSYRYEHHQRHHPALPSAPVPPACLLPALARPAS